MHRWRIGGRDIPCPVASPQAGLRFSRRVELIARWGRSQPELRAAQSPQSLDETAFRALLEGVAKPFPPRTERRHDPWSTVYQPVAVASQALVVFRPRHLHRLPALLERWIRQWLDCRRSGNPA